jgi:hypothetical protein
MNGAILRRSLATAIVAIVVMGLSARPGAETIRTFERFVARGMNMMGASAEYIGPVDITIERWSSDEELASVREALKHPDRTESAFLRAWHRTGVLMSPGVHGVGARSRLRRTTGLLFARDIKTPAGRQVVFATDHDLGFGQSKEYMAPTDYQFTLIDIRFGADGKGVGKVGTAKDVAYNQATRMIELQNFDSQPVRLAEVKLEKY